MTRSRKKTPPAPAPPARRAIGPLYPSGWLLLFVICLGILYLFIDAKTQTEVLPFLISDRRFVGSQRTAPTDWLCTVVTANDVRFEVPCDSTTMPGTTTDVCRRKRIWSGLTTHSTGRC